MPGHLCRKTENDRHFDGKYIGPALALVGEFAIGVVDGTGVLQAQFNKYSTGLGLGWYDFPEEYFELANEGDTDQEYRRPLWL